MSLILVSEEFLFFLDKFWDPCDFPRTVEFLFGGGSGLFSIRSGISSCHSITRFQYRENGIDYKKGKFYFSVNVVSLVLFKADAETLGACDGGTHAFVRAQDYRPYV